MTELMVTLLGRLVGARIGGVLLGAEIDDKVVQGIYAALLKHKVVVLQDQQLDAARFRRFARRFGTLQEHVLRKYRHAEFPDLSWLTNVASDGSVDLFGVRRATSWHSDGSYVQEPPALGMLYALEVPSAGGATLFADMCEAYDSLDEDLRCQLLDLTGLHRHGAGPGGDMYDGALDDDQEEGFKDAVHSAVIVHPDSGRQVLYVNPTHTRKFAELDAAKSAELVNRLTAHATRPPNVYTHEWAPGDLVIWDQRATIHRGAGDYPPDERRVKLRAIVQDLDLPV